jgi:type VI secretion system protein ImpK
MVTELITAIRYSTNKSTPRSNKYYPHQNALIAAANRLLTEITYIKYKKTCGNIVKFHKHLLTEMQKFQIKAETMQYDADNILISRYILSAAIDEAISKTSWGKQANWQEYSLLKELPHNTNADDHFFIILERISRAPSKFIDNIELIYLMLTLGFEGKFQDQPQLRLELQNISDQTYQIIRAYRGEINKQLSPTISMAKNFRKQKPRYFPIWLTTIITAVCIACSYLAFNYALNSRATQFVKQIQTITDKIPASS